MEGGEVKRIHASMTREKKDVILILDHSHTFLFIFVAVSNKSSVLQKVLRFGACKLAITTEQVKSQVVVYLYMISIGAVMLPVYLTLRRY